MERTPIKSQHTNLTPEKKILPPLLLGFEFATFDRESGALTKKLSRFLLTGPGSRSLWLRPAMG